MSLPVKEDGLSGPHTSLVSHHASEAEAGLRDTPILVSLMQDLFSTPPPLAEHSGMRHTLLRGRIDSCGAILITSNCATCTHS